VAQEVRWKSRAVNLGCPKDLEQGESDSRRGKKKDLIKASEGKLTNLLSGKLAKRPSNGPEAFDC